MSDADHGMSRAPTVKQLDASIAQGLLSGKHVPGAACTLSAASGR